ncbi:MAG TPA: hypothetical protein VNH84_02080, partial [Candidatus Saccharimonadales bacterium]|nr:hypothetical protein [Candidatus Saccharimonadales bacterium]
PRGTDPDLPVAEVTFREAGQFVAALNTRDLAYLKAHLEDGANYAYALPRAAEWAAYAPTNIIDEDTGLILRATGVDPHPKGVHRSRTAPATLRVFDLYGNVAEWCEGASGVPEARGGSYATLRSRAAVPVPFPPGDEEKQRLKNVGFRCVIRKK